MQFSTLFALLPLLANISAVPYPYLDSESDIHVSPDFNADPIHGNDHSRQYDLHARTDRPTITIYQTRYHTIPAPEPTGIGAQAQQIEPPPQGSSLPVPVLANNVNLAAGADTQDTKSHIASGASKKTCTRKKQAVKDGENGGKQHQGAETGAKPDEKAKDQMASPPAAAESKPGMEEKPTVQPEAAKEEDSNKSPPLNSPPGAPSAQGEPGAGDKPVEEVKPPPETPEHTEDKPAAPAPHTSAASDDKTTAESDRNPKEETLTPSENPPKDNPVPPSSPSENPSSPPAPSPSPVDDKLAAAPISNGIADNHLAPPTTGNGSPVGLGVNVFLPVDPLSFGGNLGWYYAWDTKQIKGPGMDKLEFVPMIHGEKAANELTKGVLDGYKYVLGFNEPNILPEHGGSGMSPQKAAELHKKWTALVPPETKIGSISPARGGSGFYRDWLAACGADCRVDFVTFHFYGTNIEQLKGEVAQYASYGKPIWITEIACREYRPIAPGSDQWTLYHCTKEETDKFMGDMIDYFKATPQIERWAWFGSVKELVEKNDVNSIVGMDGKANALGLRYAKN